jgi:hypothetical protein
MAVRSETPESIDAYRTGVALCNVKRSMLSCVIQKGG